MGIDEAILIGLQSNDAQRSALLKERIRVADAREAELHKQLKEIFDELSSVTRLKKKCSDELMIVEERLIFGYKPESTIRAAA